MSNRQELDRIVCRAFYDTSIYVSVEKNVRKSLTRSQKAEKPKSRKTEKAEKVEKAEKAAKSSLKSKNHCNRINNCRATIAGAA